MKDELTPSLATGAPKTQATLKKAESRQRLSPARCLLPAVYSSLPFVPYFILLFSSFILAP